MKWATERQKRREGETDFLHFLHNFLSISSLKTLVCRMCRVCFPWTGGYGTCQNKKKRKKEKKGERVRDINAPPPSCTAIQKDGVITQKTSPSCFFTFYPRVPGTLSYYYDQNTWTAHRLPTLTLREKKKQMLLAAKCIGLYFCPASRLIGVHVRQPMVDWGWGSTVGKNIRTVG